MIMSKYSEYVPTWEHPVISALIKAALIGGNTVSVYDSEEYVLKRSDSLQAIRSSLGGAGEDQLLIRDREGEQIGWFWLIYNNGSEGCPMVVISDYSANEYCDGIWNTLSARYDT
jgi:hypothetical protein